jgi:hypothetical protein
MSRIGSLLKAPYSNENQYISSLDQLDADYMGFLQYAER